MRDSAEKGRSSAVDHVVTLKAADRPVLAESENGLTLIG